MRLQAVVVAVVVIATLAFDAAPAAAARGFSWQEAPYYATSSFGVLIRARWHANYADPRCPMEPKYDNYDEFEHECFGAVAYIGLRDRFGVFQVRGDESGAVPFDDYQEDVVGACYEEREAGGPGRDWWRATWVQEIYHRSDHHGVDPHVAPVIVELDVRNSEWSEVPRCRIGQLTGNVQ